MPEATTAESERAPSVERSTARGVATVALNRPGAANALHRVAADGQALATATELAEGLAQGPTRAYAEIRGLLRSATRSSFDEMLELEAGAQRRLGRTSDHHAAVRAFLDKRTPEFEGR